MKKLGILALALALVVSVFVAGCAPAASQPSTLPELSEEQPVAEISEAPASEAPASEAPSESPDAEASVEPTGPAPDIIGTEWEVYKAIAADGSEIAEVPYSAYEFGVYDYAIEYLGDTSSAGKYEMDGNSVLMTFGEKKLLGTFTNDELEIYEGKGAYLYKQVDVPKLAGTTWNYYTDVAADGTETDSGLALSLEFGADGSVKYTTDGEALTGTYTQDGKNFELTMEGMKASGTVSYQQLLLFREDSSVVFHPQTPDVAGMTWARYECSTADGPDEASLVDATLIFGTDGSVEYQVGDTSTKGTYMQDGDGIRISLEGVDPVLGSIEGFDMRILMSEADTDAFAPVFP